MLDPHLLAILCCPTSQDDKVCHGQLMEDAEGLRCHRCGQVYAVNNNIPKLIPNKT